MRVLLVVLLVILTSDLIVAQENFLPGTIVDTSGNSLNGFIEYKNWRIAPRKILFKKEENGSVQEF